MASKKVSSDVAYQEMYQEMRRYRDYELSASAWYTTILLAILGGILAAKYEGSPDLVKLTGECFARFAAVFVVLLIGASGMWSVYFSYRRYKHIRDYVFDKKLNLEPDWKKNYEPENIFIKPRYLILAILLILVVLSIAAVFWPT
jgi:hypothetical protein